MRTSGRGVLATRRRSQRATRRGRADACTTCRRCLNECRKPPNWVLRFASVPVTGVRFLLDWASTTVAPPISDIANRAVPKIFLIVEFLRLLFPRQRLNLLDPRVNNATRVLLLRRWLSSIVRIRLGDPMYGPAVIGRVGRTHDERFVLHAAGREAERSELKRAFCSSLSEL